MRKQEMMIRRNSQRAIEKERRRRKVALIRFVLAVFAVAAAVCVIFYATRNVANAEETEAVVPMTKYYKTVTIHQGDTLWSIAEEYKSGAYASVQEYVDELKSMNNLQRDQIQAGMKLTVAYFEAES